MEHPSSEGSVEQYGSVVDVAEQLQSVGVGGTAASKDGTGLEDQLVRAEVVALEEDELVLVRQVQRPLGILHETEVQGLDASGARVSAAVAGGDQLSTPEARLDVVRARGEDGVIADGHLDGNGVGVELGG